MWRADAWLFFFYSVREVKNSRVFDIKANGIFQFTNELGRFWNKSEQFFEKRLRLIHKRYFYRNVCVCVCLCFIPPSILSTLLRDEIYIFTDIRHISCSSRRTLAFGNKMAFTHLWSRAFQLFFWCVYVRFCSFR